MQGLMKQAKLKAIMDIISQMDDLEMEKLMPKEMAEEMPMEEMKEIKPEKKGITIVKLESNKKPEMEMEEEGEEEEDEEEIDPYSTLGRLKAKLKGKV